MEIIRRIMVNNIMINAMRLMGSSLPGQIDGFSHPSRPMTITCSRTKKNAVYPSLCIVCHFSGFMELFIEGIELIVSIRNKKKLIIPNTNDSSPVKFSFSASVKNFG